MRTLRGFAFWLCLAALAQPAHAKIDDSLTVDLHAHLFMKEGLSWYFHGDFDDELKASDYRDKLSSQVNAEALERSGTGIVVNALYAHPWLTGFNPRDSIRRQIARTEKFVRLHPDWIIARSSGEARAALDSGKRVIVLSLEGASGILDTDADIAEFVRGKGIRIVTLLHLTDDQLGGVAFLRGYRAIASPWAWFSQLLSPSYDEHGLRVNRNGLTEAGRQLMRKLLNEGVWIDFAHSSDASQKEMFALVKEQGKPPLYTHTTLRKYLRAERGISDSQLAEVAKNHGIIGLIPSEEMLAGTPLSPSLCNFGNCEDSPCEGGIRALERQYVEAAEVMNDPAAVMLGTDTNGALNHLKPDCVLPRALWNLGQLGSVWDALARLGAPVPNPRAQMVERFLNSWQRAESGKR